MCTPNTLLGALAVLPGESAGKETPDKDKDKDEKADESSSPPSEKDGEQEE